MRVEIIRNVSTKTTASINYLNLRHKNFREIISFCRERITLKDDLVEMNTKVGTPVSLVDINEMAEYYKRKHTVEDIGLEYHVEVTRWDFSLIVFVIIKRDFIKAQKFVFRYRKIGGETNYSNLDYTHVDFNQLLKGGKNENK